MNVRKIILLAISIVTIKSIMAQQKPDYDAYWQKVTAAENKGLPQTAIASINTIYHLSLKQGNDAQQIKAAIYLMRYKDMLQENSQEKNMLYFDTLISKAKAPAKNILQLMKADLYVSFLNNNRWKLYNRTTLIKEDSKDVNTWSITKLNETITALYNTSLQNELLLQKIKLDQFDPIIIKGENTRYLRPTLFDLIAHQCLSYFMTDESDLVKPSYQFKLDDNNLFAPVTTFIATDFKNKDTVALQYQALKLLQRILKFHINDAKSDALIDADLIRIHFVNQYSTLEQKEKLYEQALVNIEQRYSTSTAAAQAMYLRANIYYNKGIKYDKNNKLHQYEIKRAKDLCDVAVNKFPKSEGAINCTILLNEITSPILKFEVEKVNVPDQPFRMLVKYKNAPTVYFRLIKTNTAEINSIEKNEYHKKWEKISILKTTLNWQVDLPDPKDYQQHQTEIKVGAIKNGVYYLVASLNKSFSLNENIIAKQIIHISNIASINSDNKYYILHRQNGLPIANAKVSIWENKYDYKTNNYESTKAETYTTDKNGLFNLQKFNENRNFSLQIIAKDDELQLVDRMYNDGYNGYTKYTQPNKPVSFLFLDRSIYRPGQTIYFKGIVIEKNENPLKNKVLPDFSTTIRLIDANGQKINELKVVTNAYGSYNGSFKLPEGSLNGNFSINDSNTNNDAYFNVEEYKRPKFLVEIKKPTGMYRVNDSILITGTALGYAGNNINGATVKYRVVRKLRYPIWFGWQVYGKQTYPYGRGGEMEITNGNGTTDKDGKFIINFKAIPDESIAKKDQPIFYYEINADVTDLNGETRSGTEEVAVAYQALQMKIEVAEKLNIDSLAAITIKTFNLNNLEEKTATHITIQQLKNPHKIFRERLWEMPDQFVMSEEEYNANFPYDVYKNENETANFPVEKTVFEKADSSNASIKLLTTKFAAGWYKIIAIAKDKYGEEVRAEKFIQLTSIKELSKSAITITKDKAKAEPGEKIQYTVGTGFDKIWLINTISKMNDIEITSYQTITDSKPISITDEIVEKDRGGIAINYIFIKNNRIYKGVEAIEIPWNNKDLVINYSTFRDKLLPGAKEKWTVKISGNKGEKVAAEVLASMYDASLDQFKEHSWSNFNLWPIMYNKIDWSSQFFGSELSDEYNLYNYNNLTYRAKIYDRFINNDYFDNVSYRGIKYQNATMEKVMETSSMSSPNATKEVKQLKFTPPKIVKDEEQSVENQIVADSASVAINIIEKPAKPINSIQIRKNFNETAFFYPDLKTDSLGNVSFSFTMPEALTKWKLQTFAHSSKLESAYLEKMLITQKPLMVQPFAPRFMREGDNMEFTAKIINVSDSEITGTTSLQLMDATNNKPLDGWFKNVFPNQYFTVAAKQSIVVKFPITIPFNFNSALSYTITATSIESSAKEALFSDGESMMIPILTNRMLVTESMPMNVKSNTTKRFKFSKLLNSDSMETISNHALTVEYASNPAWYAIQALPYMMEYPYECAEQTFNRYYANTLAAFITSSTPSIKSIFSKWATTDTAALLSNLQKNEALKSILLQETPWVLDAQNESQQKKNIALLFDMVKMATEQEKAFSKLKEMQSPNGGFVWFKGGRDDRYITQYIITGIGHLIKLKAITLKDYTSIEEVVNNAIAYLDEKIKEDYDNLIKNKVKLKSNNLNYTAIQYLYMRTFFSNQKIPLASQKALDYYSKQSTKYWVSQNKYMQAMIALAKHRMGDRNTAMAIVKSLEENSIVNDELGMYWKEWANGGGYYWHQAPIESQALMIEAFAEISGNNNTVTGLKTWLLNQKQTHHWLSTKATAEACYALLLKPGATKKGEVVESILDGNNTIEIKMGNIKINSNDNKNEAGTGYFKKSYAPEKITSTMGDIEVAVKSETNNNLGVWGAVYWQYFQDIDKITSAVTPLKLKKQLYVEKNTDNGPVLSIIEDGTSIAVGDKIKVRIELTVDRDMEYVHMKDMRAACTEPVNVISGYKYQGGLGYYESTKDASTNFFFNYLNKGTYVFEYPLFVTHAGNFSNGITTIQCMYAPQFTSHSDGIRINVEPNEK